jgi:hypothetical protein
METNKSLDVGIPLISAILRDAQNVHQDVFSLTALRLTLQKVLSRSASEGIGFLTKTLPRLAKAFDKALVRGSWTTQDFVGFQPARNCEFPKFLGELFSVIFSQDGKLLAEPSCTAIRSVRQILIPFKKYEIPYTPEQEHEVLSTFKRVDSDLAHVNARFAHYEHCCANNSVPDGLQSHEWKLLLDAKRALHRALAACNLEEIRPKHGPGVVSTKERLWRKYEWSNIPKRITDQYPLDAYFYASIGHVCDSYKEISSLRDAEQFAQVILVPKDSRGPRLISCEPLVYQYIQQGIKQALVDHIESSPHTRGSVNFSDQTPNRMAAIDGSYSGDNATLDLSEASDRVSLGLVKFLFPEHILSKILCCRTLATTLPGGEVIQLNKFAPMGSALCFPVLALVCWAITTSVEGIRGDASKGVLVYGDDIIVPAAQAASAIKALEFVGLKVNQDKSCTTGFFRESCGMDAYYGNCVTPTRFKTLWSSLPSPDSYVAWLSYANAFYDKRYYHTYDTIVGLLARVYREIPADEDFPSREVPTLRIVPEELRPRRVRTNPHLQKRERFVYVIKPKRVTHETENWNLLLRYFTEGNRSPQLGRSHKADLKIPWDLKVRVDFPEPFSVREYTERHASKLVKRWR